MIINWDNTNELKKHYRLLRASPAIVAQTTDTSDQSPAFLALENSLLSNPTRIKGTMSFSLSYSSSALSSLDGLPSPIPSPSQATLWVQRALHLCPPAQLRSGAGRRHGVIWGQAGAQGWGRWRRVCAWGCPPLGWLHSPSSCEFFFFFFCCFLSQLLDEKSLVSWMVVVICALDEVRMEFISCWYWLVVVFLCWFCWENCRWSLIMAFYSLSLCSWCGGN